MDITLYKNLSGTENDLSPNLAAASTLANVQIVEEVNDNTPTIRFAVPTDQLKWSAVNYLRWDGAYYFIRSVTKLANGLSSVNAEMDELHTYASAIQGWTALFERKSGGTLRAEDEARLVSADSRRSVFRFADQISKTENAGTYVLVTSQKGFEAAI